MALDYGPPKVGSTKVLSRLASTGAVDRNLQERNADVPLLTDFETETDFEAAETAAAAVLPSAAIRFKTSGSGAVARSALSKLREIVSVKDFGAVGDGVTNEVAAFQAVAANAAGQTIHVPYGTYLFAISSDSDTIQLPSNCALIADSGTIFKWSYMGSPLICIAEKENVLIDGIIFEWNGTLAEVSGSNSSRFNWTFALPNRDFCAHVLSLGSSRVKVRNCASRTTGDNPSAATQCFYQFASFHHSDDGTTRSQSNGIEDCQIDDVVMGSLISGQDNFSFRNITSRRFPGNHPVGGGSGLAGHLLYSTDNGGTLDSRNLIVDNVTDIGTGVGTITSRTDTSIQTKQTTGSCIANVVSSRPTGIFSGGEIKNMTMSGMVWQPSSVESNGIGISALNGVGIQDSVMKDMCFVLPDNADKAAWNMASLSRCVVDAYISASHTTGSIASSILTTCLDNKVSISYCARNTTSLQPVNLTSNSLRNYIKITPVGQNHTLRPFVNSGSTDNTIRLEDNVINKWSSATWWTTESDSPAIGFEAIKKTKVYRIGTTTDPTTTFQLARAGVWVGTVQVIEASGAHLLGGLYRITWDTGSLQSVELLGTQWTVGANAPTALNLAVSNAGVVTVTTTAVNQAWDIVYDFQSLGNNRYADY